MTLLYIVIIQLKVSRAEGLRDFGKGNEITISMLLPIVLILQLFRTSCHLYYRTYQQKHVKICNVIVRYYA